MKAHFTGEKKKQTSVGKRYLVPSHMGTQEDFLHTFKNQWEGVTYLAPDIDISIFVQQSTDYLYMSSSHCSSQHRLPTLNEWWK